jgi:DNA modification methylase
LWAVKPKTKHKGGWTFNKRKSVSYERGVFKHPVIRHAHPNKKPDRIFRNIIKIFSNEGDLVLDPFAGAGTTAVAAQQTGRRHISFEQREDYFDLAIEELKKVVPVNRYEGLRHVG